MEFENVSEPGSNTTAFEKPTLAVRVREGAKMILPEGIRHPALKKLGQLTFDWGIGTVDAIKVLGFMTNIFEFRGVPMTFPFGASIKLLNPSVPTMMFEAARVTGLNCMTLALPGEGVIKFPLGRRHAPC